MNFSLNPHGYTPEQIEKDLFIPDAPYKTKYLVVHGLKCASAALARAAVEAYKRGDVEKLVFTGGAPVRDYLAFVAIATANPRYFLKDGLKGIFNTAKEFFSSDPEAIFMANIAKSLGVDPNDIIIENNGKPTSSNTPENVRNLLENTHLPKTHQTLQEAFKEEGAISVMGLTYNTRRQCGTWSCITNDELIIIPRSIYPYNYTPENWKNSLLTCWLIVYPEMAKIDPNNDNAYIKIHPEDVKTFPAEEHLNRAEAKLESLQM